MDRLVLLKNINILVYTLMNLILITALFLLDNGWIYVLVFSVTAHARDSMCAFANVAHDIYTAYVDNTASVQAKTKAIAAVIPCYNEPVEEIQNTISTLDAQEGLSSRTKIFHIIIFDGYDVGFTAFCDLLDDNHHTMHMQYACWNGKCISIDITCGILHNIPVVLICKLRNNGKKCSLIVADEILSDVFYETAFFTEETQHIIVSIRTFLHKHKITQLDVIFHTDADTIIHPLCIQRLTTHMNVNGVDAVCGFVKVDFSNGHRLCNFWNNLQFCQYFADQLLKRRTELIFGGVTCMPGCNCIVNPNTPFFSAVIRNYRRLPNRNSLIQTVSRMIGTDRCYTKALLKEGARVSMECNSVVYTSCPQSLGALYRQRKRWNSNAMSNAVCVLRSHRTKVLSKVNSFIDLLRLYFAPFRFAAMIGFFMQIMHCDTTQVILISLLILPPYLYVAGMCLFWEKEARLNILIGYVFNKMFTPFFSVYVTSGLMLRLLNFNWNLNKPEETTSQISISVK